MAKIVIDSQEIDVPAHYTLLQACEEVGAEIPRFCFHERLSVAGNCRMCLVEVAGSPKPVASCAMAVKDLRPGPNGEPPVVKTNSKIVKKAREGVMEFLLINHPLDCPICDQGGECDLQDQAMAYGADKTRYTENKRAVEDKNIGPLVQTVMTRCIHCTRCIRFTTEVAGVSDLGAIGRGEDMEITTYLEAAMTSELQGNVIDLCPVGALTSKPYAFTARSWELSKTQSIDAMDAMGAAIRIDSRGREVMRIVPRENALINEEWLSDKSRFIWDGLKTQRLDKPYIRKGGKLVASTWEQAFDVISEKFATTEKNKIGFISGGLATVEEQFALKTLAQSLGIKAVDGRPFGSQLNSSHGRASFTFNATIAGIENVDALLIIGANPRLEAPVLNARIRKRALSGAMPVALIGEQADLTYKYTHLGTGAESLAQFLEGKDAFFKTLKDAQNPMMIVGEGVVNRKDGATLLAQIATLGEKIKLAHETDGALWNGLCVLHTQAATVGALELALHPEPNSKDLTKQNMCDGAVDVLFNMGEDECDIKPGVFVIYQGSHGDRGAHRADVILPAANYTEKTGTYINLEGRVQSTLTAVYPPGDARDDWAILRALSEKLGAKLPFDSFSALRKALYAAYPQLAALGEILGSDLKQGQQALKNLAGLKGEKVAKASFKSPIEDFYLSNPIARASKVMAQCSQLRQGSKSIAAE